MAGKGFARFDSGASQRHWTSLLSAEKEGWCSPRAWRLQTAVPNAGTVPRGPRFGRGAQQ